MPSSWQGHVANESEWGDTGHARAVIVLFFLASFPPMSAFSLPLGAVLISKRLKLALFADVA